MYWHLNWRSILYIYISLQDKHTVKVVGPSTPAYSFVGCSHWPHFESNKSWRYSHFSTEPWLWEETISPDFMFLLGIRHGFLFPKEGSLRPLPPICDSSVSMWISCVVTLAVELVAKGGIGIRYQIPGWNFNRKFSKLFRYLKWRNPHLCKLYGYGLCKGKPTPKIAL